MLLSQIDKKLGNLTSKIAKTITDNRDERYTKHSVEKMVKQLIYGIALGYEDLNDHNKLRKDIGLQTAVNSNNVLASSPTLCRLQNLATRKTAIEINKKFVETFIKSFNKKSKKIILDFDSTDDRIHGNQENAEYNGYYKSYCFLPLYVFCGEHLLVSYLRRSRIDGAKHAWAILSLLVKRIRQKWPDVSIIFRGDSGFCRPKMLAWCDKNDVGYVLAISKNNNLLKEAVVFCKKAHELYEEKEGSSQIVYGTFKYSAGSWKNVRKVVVKAEHNRHGSNTRFIVTNLSGVPKKLYEDMYCPRGDMENRIKEQQLDLFADRTSSHDWHTNNLRNLLSSSAYVLISGIRRIALKGTVLAKAQCGTIRLKLFKIGAVLIQNTRRIKFLLSSSYPYKELFIGVYHKLCPG